MKDEGCRMKDEGWMANDDEHGTTWYRMNTDVEMKYHRKTRRRTSELLDRRSNKCGETVMFSSPHPTFNQLS